MAEDGPTAGLLFSTVGGKPKQNKTKLKKATS